MFLEIILTSFVEMRGFVEHCNNCCNECLELKLSVFRRILCQLSSGEKDKFVGSLS